MKEVKKKIIIIGAGFGGVAIARSLKKANASITLIDQNNYHNFQPLMYQVATGGLEPDSIAYPIRRILRNQENAVFRMGEVTHIDRQNNKLTTSFGEICYDYLVIATGSTNNFFNFENIKDQLFSLKSIPDALNLRSFIFQNLEKALSNQSADKQELMSVAIVGGGPAGVELAGALAEMKRFVLPVDFPDLDLSQMKINLYEASPKLLAAMSEKSSEKTLEYVKHLGIDVHLNAKVKSYQNDQISLESGQIFHTHTVIWTAGVKAALIDGLEDASITEAKRIKVDEFNQVVGTHNIFAIGDVCSHQTEQNPRGLPMLAPVAQQHGKLLAKNLQNLLANKPMVTFSYFNKGVMATIGRNKAVVDLRKLKFQGVFAWWVWMFVHLMSLVGFRNKIVTFVDWMTNYINYDRPLGLIIRPFKKPKQNS